MAWEGKRSFGQNIPSFLANLGQPNDKTVLWFWYHYICFDMCLGK